MDNNLTVETSKKDYTYLQNSIASAIHSMIFAYQEMTGECVKSIDWVDGTYVLTIGEPDIID